MLDMMGCGYVVDCCISAFNHKQKQLNYQIYLTDAAMTLINMFSNGGKFPRYFDLIHPEKKDDRTGAEIAADIIKRHGLKVVG